MNHHKLIALATVLLWMTLALSVSAQTVDKAAGSAPEGKGDADKAAPDKAAPDKAPPDKAAPDKSASDGKKPAAEKKAAEKGAPGEKSKTSAKKSEAVEESAVQDEAEAAAETADADEAGTAASAEEGAAPDSASEDEELREESDEDAEGTANTAELGSGAAGGSQGMALTPPKSLDLDMSALGQLDPEKELAEGGEVDKKAEAKTETKDWTERAMDMLELHGYYRLRPELYHKFHIRHDDYVFNQTAEQQDRGVKNNTSAGANMRFRLEPTLNISENIRIKSQIDFLDNVMLGSTPRYWQGYTGIEAASDTSTLAVGRVQGWDMGPPEGDQMVAVKRVWGEVKTPFGHLRFGRMGDDWGLGMLHNAGNELQNDFGDSVDRILFAAKINDWLIMPAFDFPNEGMSSSDASGRPFDVSQLDDSYRLLGIFGYIHDKEEQLTMLKRGDFVINTGIYFPYQWQVMSFENPAQSSGTYDPACESTAYGNSDAQTAAAACPGGEYQFYKREVWQIAPDFWFQVLYGTLHLELEAALIYGEVGNPSNSTADADTLNPLTLLQWGMVLQLDYGLLQDALRIGAEFGMASGDKDTYGLRAPSTYDQDENADNKFNAFSFNPGYDMDLILHHHILGSVAQSMYIKAWVKYDFLKNPMGRNIGLRADVIYSRAMFEDNTISQTSANLGVELNAKLLYRSQDGFYAGLSYGVLFPLNAFKGDPDEGETNYGNQTDLDIPQTLQGIFGISF